MQTETAAVLAAKLSGPRFRFRAFVQDDRLVFVGGRCGAHSLDIATSSVERVEAHWAAYALRPASWAAPVEARIRVGSKVLFTRGMFGEWKGTVRKIYTARETERRLGGERMAIVSYTRKNGSAGRVRVALAGLTLAEG